MFEEFVESLPPKVRCTNDFEEGLAFRKKERALQHKYIALNQSYKKYIVVDIDKPGASHLWYEKGLPAPTIITINRNNAHCHCLWEINTPIIYTANGRLKPQKWFEAIEATITQIVGGDLSYGGLMTKTPNHRAWDTEFFNKSYDLEDFKEYFDILPSRKIAIQPHEKGRNNTLFTTVYSYGRKIALKFNSQEQLISELVSYGQSVNESFLDMFGSVLPYKEAVNTSRSAARRAWKMRHTKFDNKNRGILADQITEDMSLSSRQKLGAQYSHIVRTEKVDDKIKAAIHKCQSKNLPLTKLYLTKNGLSESTYFKYRQAVESWIRLLS